MKLVRPNFKCLAHCDSYIKNVKACTWRRCCWRKKIHLTQKSKHGFPFFKSVSEKTTIKLRSPTICERKTGRKSSLLMMIIILTSLSGKVAPRRRRLCWHFGHCCCHKHVNYFARCSKHSGRDNSTGFCA